MKKVYVLVELYTFDYASDYRVSVYADKEKAADAFKSRVERETTDSWIGEMDKENLIINYNEEKLEFDVYPDGNAAEYETTIMVLEKEVW